MYHRLNIVFILFLAFSLPLMGWTVIDEPIEQAILKVTYSTMVVRDTLIPKEDFITDLLTLKSGSTVSAFYSARLKTEDSLEKHTPDYFYYLHADKELLSQNSRLSREVIFKNYPKGMIRHMDRFDSCHWQIDENMEKPDWNVTDSTTNILGFECVMATTSFRGRKWTVWFSPEIPVSDGPWKLWGLPGLILKAEDSRHHYSYEATSVETEGIGNVEYFDYYGNRFIATRQKALQIKRKDLQRPLGYEILSSGAYGIKKMEGLKRPDKIPHANYDFEETDYPHE